MPYPGSRDALLHTWVDRQSTFGLVERLSSANPVIRWYDSRGHGPVALVRASEAFLRAFGELACRIVASLRRICSDNDDGGELERSEHH